MELVKEPVVEVVRLEESKQGTFGLMRLNKRVACLTLEPPDKENKRSLSSIPAQQYICRRHQSPRFGETFRVEDVPDRDNVLFHPGNEVAHTKGCILLGSALLDGKARGVSGSRKAFEGFMQAMEGVERFHLTIHEQF